METIWAHQILFDARTDRAIETALSLDEEEGIMRVKFYDCEINPEQIPSKSNTYKTHHCEIVGREHGYSFINLNWAIQNSIRRLKSGHIVDFDMKFFPLLLDDLQQVIPVTLTGWSKWKRRLGRFFGISTSTGIQSYFAGSLLSGLLTTLGTTVSTTIFLNPATGLAGAGLMGFLMYKLGLTKNVLSSGETWARKLQDYKLKTQILHPLNRLKHSIFMQKAPLSTYPAIRKKFSEVAKKARGLRTQSDYELYKKEFIRLLEVNPSAYIYR